MSANLEPRSSLLTGRTKGGLIAGSILILAGSLSLAGVYLNSTLLQLLFLPALAAIFLTAGLLSRSTGLIIPGGILAGVGGGVLLASTAAAKEQTGGLVLLCMAAGWALISLLALYTTPGKFTWWPLIPASALALIGGLLVTNGPLVPVMTFMGVLWPLVLIIFGLVLILRKK